MCEKQRDAHELKYDNGVSRYYCWLAVFEWEEREFISNENLLGHLEERGAYTYP